MKVLIIKTSSLGDVIHTLPALTDAGAAIPGIRFDWIIEEAFAEIPAWHPLVDKIIPIAWRRWRKNLFTAPMRNEWKNFYHVLRAEKYSYVIDAQGLIKSAVLACLARGTRCGLDRNSAREPLAALVYQHRYPIARDQHAVMRVRQLFARALGYTKTTDLLPDYGINLNYFLNVYPCFDTHEKYIVFLHGTTWPTKHWPENYWRELAQRVTQAGYHVYLPWGNPTEQARAQRIALMSSQIEVLPKLNLTAIAAIIARAEAVVAVDTGLGHLAAALKIPTLSLYGPTNPVLTGTMGINQFHLTARFSCAPCLQKISTYQGPREVEPACFGTLPPDLVWRRLQEMLFPGNAP